MKITKKYLQKIIEEEAKTIMEQNDPQQDLLKALQALIEMQSARKLTDENCVKILQAIKKAMQVTSP
ncbi:MAG TPA: hypothetical protein DEB18_16510 [Leeuwenhoekiella sp.]|nr:hypothetical protein [Leeuwenhoekiella sp.]